MYITEQSFFMSEKVQARILVIDDDEDVLHAARLFLKQHVSEVVIGKAPSALPDLLENQTFNVIMLDMNFTRDKISGDEGFHWLQIIKELAPEAVVILMTAYGDTETAVKAIKLGATDFILKPWQNDKLWATISTALELNSSKTELSSLKKTNAVLNAQSITNQNQLLGKSKAMQSVFKLIDKVASTDANVLILGEHGTGKELVAKALHQKSTRSSQAFINVDMGAISESLFESELFGHVKGSFTDAKEDRVGRFEAAQKGTLFLDEIGNLSLPMQAKLLSALQSRSITKVGSNKSINIDTRLICATNSHLNDLAQSGQFRQDLLYRINTVEIVIPSLRERKEDILVLADHFLTLFARKYQKGNLKLSSDSSQFLLNYEWPGNVRELEHAIERACIMAENEHISPNDFSFFKQKFDDSAPLLESGTIEDVEKRMVEQILAKHEGNISRAAKELGLTRTSLYRRMQKYDL